MLNPIPENEQWSQKFTVSEETVIEYANLLIPSIAQIQHVSNQTNSIK